MFCIVSNYVSFKPFDQSHHTKPTTLLRKYVFYTATRLLFFVKTDFNFQHLWVKFYIIAFALWIPYQNYWISILSPTLLQAHGIINIYPNEKAFPGKLFAKNWNWKTILLPKKLLLKFISLSVYWIFQLKVLLDSNNVDIFFPNFVFSVVVPDLENLLQLLIFNWKTHLIFNGM